MARARASGRGVAGRAAPAAARPKPAARARPAPIVVVPWTWVALVAAAAFAAFANSLGGALLYDDVNAIRNNPFVRGGDVAGILTEASWWGIGRGPLWRPVTTLTFALNHALHGLAPFGYHLVNVLLHAGVSALVLLVFAAATAAPRTALAAALLFATHPVHAEAVASVVGRAELLAAGGFFAAWLCWLAADPARGGRRPLWLAGAVLAYFLAMAAKENAVTLPLVLLCAEGLRTAETDRAARVRRRRADFAALAVAAGAFVVLRGAVLGGLTPSPDLLDNPLGALAPGPRLMTAVKVVGLYALRLLFPLWLSADYSFDQVAAVTSPLDPAFLGGLAVIVGVPAAAWWARTRLAPLALGLGVLALTFAVVSNLVFLIGTIMGERLLYLPSAGFCLALGAAIVRAGGGVDGPGRARRWPTALVALLGVVVVLYGARTIARNRVWHDALGFFIAMVADAPRSARSHRELATILGDMGRLDEARASFERSLAIKPEDATTLYNFGNAVSQAGRFDEAVALYQRALARKPDFVEALENLGNAESMRGDQPAALAAFERARALAPQSPMLEMNVANAHFRMGALAEARAAYERALVLAPGSPHILTNYGSFLYAQGEYAAAARAFERIPPPAPPRALAALVASYRAQGLAAQAAAAQAAAERLYPADPGVRQMAETLRRDGTAAGGAP